MEEAEGMNSLEPVPPIRLNIYIAVFKRDLDRETALKRRCPWCLRISIGDIRPGNAIFGDGNLAIINNSNTSWTFRLKQEEPAFNNNLACLQICPPWIVNIIGIIKYFSLVPNLA